MWTFEKAEQFLQSGRNKNQRTIAGIRATLVHRIDENAIALRYQYTDVVTFHRDGTYTLNTGGWYTMTTKDRINTYGPVGVWSENGIWYYRPNGFEQQQEPYSRARVKFPKFYDGLRVNASGWPVDGDLKLDDTAYFERAKKRIDKAANEFVKGYIKAAIQRKGLETPSMADCIPCQANVTLTVTQPNDFHGDNRGRNHPSGEALGMDHYLEHFREKYYVPSIAVKAVRERGYRDPGVILAMIQGDLQQGRHSDLLEENLRAFFTKRKRELASALLDAEEAQQREVAGV